MKGEGGRRDTNRIEAAPTLCGNKGSFIFERRPRLARKEEEVYEQQEVEHVQGVSHANERSALVREMTNMMVDVTWYSSVGTF